MNICGVQQQTATYPSDVSCRVGRGVDDRGLRRDHKGFRVTLERSTGEVPLGADTGSTARRGDVVVLTEYVRVR